jgi:hypothetical protein
MQEVSIRTPAVPEELENLFKGIWILEYSSFSGDVATRELDWSGGIPPSFSLSRKKEEDLLILLSSPVSFPGRGFFPAGLWLPWDKGRGEASFHDGAAVFLVSALVQEGVPMKAFNMERFLEEMRTLDNPWNCDRDLLLRQLGRHEMCSWYIHERRTLSVSLILPPGLWHRANPEAPPLVSDGSPAEIELAEGYHFLFCPEREEGAEVQVNDHGEAAVLLSRLSGLTGSSPGGFRQLPLHGGLSRSLQIGVGSAEGLAPEESPVGRQR